MLYLLKILTAAILLTGSAVSATAAVQNTPHDLSAFGPIAMYQHDTDEICTFCHTPHGASGAVSLLWNRASNPATGYYTMYTGTTTWSTATNAARTLNPESLICMSCHDGSLALSTVLNTPHSDGAQPISFQTGDSTSLKMADRISRPGPKIGDALNASGTLQGVTTDLTDDHPVSMNYQATGGADLNGYVAATVVSGQDVVSSVSGDLPLYSNGGGLTVECATCHSVHDNTSGSFLRFANDASNMCYTCHIK